VRIAFLLRHALYLRNFESALRQFAGRGHEILLIFTPLQQKFDTTLLASLTRDHPSIREQRITARTGWWWPVSDGARAFRDCLRYLEPAYQAAPALVDRGMSRLPTILRFAFHHVPGLNSRPGRATLDGAMRLIERIIPPDPGAVAALQLWSPDLLVVTPMVDFSYGQTDYVKAARHLGIPTILAVASWDNLTNKGVIQVCPDLVVVWNEIQEREAITMHHVPRERIRKTGAQLYDHWFEMAPSLDRAAFCARVGGLDPAKPIILYLCSSLFICREEVSFVKEWLVRLRQSADASLREANVIVRPHPMHADQWSAVDLLSLGRVRVWPREGGTPIDPTRKRDYFDSLYHAGVVVGINTSGFIEAGIVGRRTLTLACDRFRATQEGTLHFHYLTEGGLLEVARNYDDHFAQLSQAFAKPQETEDQVQAFIGSFVRPEGIDKPATPLFVEAIESAKSLQAQTCATPAYAPLLRAAVWPLAVTLRRKVLERLTLGMHGGIERTAFPKVLPPKGKSTRLSNAETETFAAEAKQALAAIAKSDKPIIVGPWMSEVGYELLYWIPMLRWAQDAYGLDRERLIVVSRGGVESWYGDLAGRYVDLFDCMAPEKFAALNAERRLDSGLQKQKQLSASEEGLLKTITEGLQLKDYDLLHPRLMYGGLYRCHWSGRSAFDHLLLHSRYLPFEPPAAGKIEARLPEDYYSVRFYSRDSFTGNVGNRQFVRDLIERLLQRRDVVLLESPFALDDHDNIAWMEAATNSDRSHNNCLIRVGGWMTPRNNLEVQTRVIARSRCFLGTYGGLSYLAPFLGRPSIAFHQERGELSDPHANAAMTVFRAFNVPFQLLTPDTAKLLDEIF
jgi:hypothetical protein